jgi:hypothetical protein
MPDRRRRRTVFWDIIWFSTVGKFRHFGKNIKMKTAGEKTDM